MLTSILVCTLDMLLRLPELYRCTDIVYIQRIPGLKWRSIAKEAYSISSAITVVSIPSLAKHSGDLRCTWHFLTELDESLTLLHVLFVDQNCNYDGRGLDLVFLSSCPASNHIVLSATSGHQTARIRACKACKLTHPNQPRLHGKRN